MHHVTICAALVLVLHAGCGDDGAASVDAPVSRACDGRAYDPCSDTTNSGDCMAGLSCRFFMSQSFTICSPTCDASNPCPADDNGNAVACNMMGRCRADAPNSCTQ